jgi:hippurate hydrolase
VAAHIITAAQTIVSRNLNPMQAGVVSLCAVEAGKPEGFNVIPRKARLTGTTRAFSEASRTLIENRLREIVTNIASAFNATATLTYERLDPPTVNHTKEAALAAKVVKKLFGDKALTNDLEPSMGGEDFSYFLEKIPGAYLRVGQADDKAEHNRFLHNDGYDFNDDIIPIGAALLAGIVEEGE